MRRTKDKKDAKGVVIPGVVVQDCDVYVGRKLFMGGWKLKQSKWHNPFKVEEKAGASKAEKRAAVVSAVEKYRKYLLSKPELVAAIKPELRGKTLGCWCKNKPTDPCHADVLAAMANA